MARRRTFVSPPAAALTRAVDTHAAMHAEPASPEAIAAGVAELERLEATKRPARKQNRNAGGRFA